MPPEILSSLQFSLNWHFICAAWALFTRPGLPHCRSTRPFVGADRDRHVSKAGRAATLTGPANLPDEGGYQYAEF